MPDLYFLIEFPIFREFEGEDVEVLTGLCEELVLPAGAAVVREGQPADAMYIVKSGVLNVGRTLGGEFRHINLLSAGEFFGEMALIDGSPRSADVLVKEDAVLVKFSIEAYKRLRRERPSTALRIADVLLKTLSFRVRRSTAKALQSAAPTPPLPLISNTPPSPPPSGEGRGGYLVAGGEVRSGSTPPPSGEERGGYLKSGGGVGSPKRKPRPKPRRKAKRSRRGSKRRRRA